MRKIICFIDDLCLGGAQRQLVGLANLLRNNEYNVRFCTYHNNGFYIDTVIENGISYDYSEKMENNFTRIFEFIKYLKKESPDVVVSYVESPCIIACISKILYPHFKLIVSERNVSQKNGLTEFIRFQLFRVADHIVTNSYSQEKFINNHYEFLKSKVTTITNFVDTSKFVSAKTIESSSIVSVGRISPQKNILNYLRAIKIIKDSGLKIHFDWYGDTDNLPYQQMCYNLISYLDISDYITFHPAVKNILPIYQSAFALCLPSIYEGFPNVVCEAMSCGVPILCSDICDNPDIVTDGTNGFLFNPNDIEDIAMTIKKFCSLDYEILKKMNSNNREKALLNFSPENFFDKYRTLIEN